MTLKQYVSSVLGDTLDIVPKTSHPDIEFDIGISPQFDSIENKWDIVISEDPNASRIKFTVSL